MMIANWTEGQTVGVGLDGGEPSQWESDRPDETARLDEAITLLEIAMRHRECRCLDKAKRFARRALTIFERELGPTHPKLATVLLCLGGVHRDRGEYERAEAHYLRATSILNRLPQDAADPEIPRLRLQTARGLADVVCALGRYCEADPMLKQALTMAERTFGRQSGETAGVLHDLAVFYKYTGRFEKASRLLADALTIAENADGPDHPQVATILHSIAVLDLLRGRFEHGELYARRAVTVREKTFGPDHPQVAADIVTLAAILDGRGEYAAAESGYRRALLMFERWFGPDHYDVATTLSGLATLLRSRNRVAEAEPLYRRALSIFDRPVGPSDVTLAPLSERCA